MPRNLSPPPSFAEEFIPKFVTVLREGYHLADFRADAQAALQVAIVALPLSMAIAIASGLGPESGLFTAIIGGFVISLMGGSRFQIGGPAGAFIVLISACVADIGSDGLIVATSLSGVFLMVVGLFRLGTYIKFIPYPVTVGFTAGIGIIIFSTQIKDLFGLTLAGPEPAPLFAKLGTLWAARGTVAPEAIAVALGTIVTIVALKRLRASWPGMLIAVALAAALVALLGLPIETVQSRFGSLPHMLPMPGLPTISLDLLGRALPYAVSFALLGAITSLLSAVVADGMTGRRHRSNAELVAQGIANIASSLFGGFCVTGAIARTVTNVRSGSHGPVSGMLHAAYLLLFLLIAAPLAGYVPLAALAGVLALVSWDMIAKAEIRALLRTSSGDALVLLATLLLVIFRDLTSGIVVGFALGGVLFIKRMSETARVELAMPLVPEDEADSRLRYDPSGASDAGVLVYRIRGAFFFGAASTVSGVLDRIADRPRAFVVDFSEVPFTDSTAAHAMDLLARKMARQGGQLYLTGASPDVRRALLAGGLREPDVHYRATIAEAVAEARG